MSEDHTATEQAGASANTHPPSDPLDALRGAIFRLEARVDEIATAFMSTEEVANVANAAMKVRARMNEGVSRHMSRQLSYFNMPSREDVAALGERLSSMEDRLVRIDGALARLAPPPKKTAAKVSRTRKPAAAAKRRERSETGDL